MKFDAVKALRAKLRSNTPVSGLWVTLEAPSITEVAVALGCDYVVVDAEHGALDWGEVLQHVRATVRSGTCAFVRLCENGNVDVNNSAQLIKRALDIGADGVLIPCVDTAQQVQSLLSQARYPFYEPAGAPRGIRGIGGERATVFGAAFVDHVEQCAAEPPFVVPLLETHTAFLNRHEIAKVEGLDFCQLGPADHSASKGFAGEWEGGDVGKETVLICDALSKQGVRCGVMCRDNDDIIERAKQGFRVLTIGFDISLLMRTVKEALVVADNSGGCAAGGGQQREPTTAFAPKL